MLFVDIKNTSRQPVVIQLSKRESGLTPDLAQTKMARSKMAVDKASGEKRRLNYTFEAPPAITIAPGATYKGLPEVALKNKQLAALTRRRPGRKPTILVVKGAYEVKPQATAPKKTSSKKTTKKTSRKK